MKNTKWFCAFIVLGILMFLTAPLWAQATASPGPQMGPLATIHGFSFWQMLIPVLVPLIIALEKTLFGFVQPRFYPVLAPFLGFVADFIAQKSGLYSANPIIAAMLGASGVGVREIVDQHFTGQGAVDRALKVAVLFLGLSFCLAGCAMGGGAKVSRETWTPTVTGKETNIVHSVETAKTSPFIAFGDAVQNVAKMKAGNTKTGNSIGLSGYESETTSGVLTNGAEGFGRAAKVFFAP